MTDFTLGKVRVILVISLAVNVFLAGMFAGKLAHKDNWTPPPPPPGFMAQYPDGHGMGVHSRVGKNHRKDDRHGMPPFMSFLAQDMTDAQKKAVFSFFKSLHKQHRGVMEKIHASRQDTLDVIAAEPFDEKRVREKMAVTEKYKDEMFQNFADTLVETVGKMPVEDRKVFVEALKMMPPPPPMDQ